jgi:hypothetical protein
MRIESPSISAPTVAGRDRPVHGCALLHTGDMAEHEGTAFPTRTVFEERQRFREPWAVGLIVVLAAGAWGGLAWSLLVEGSELQPAAMAVMVVIFGLVFPVFLYLLELNTVVDPAGVQVRFRHGFAAHRFATAEMASAQSVTYRPLRDLGGWGVRWGWGHSRAYNVSGDRGVEIVDTDGRRWVIGSQRSEELAAAITGIGVQVGPDGSDGAG